ncbi:hypothetical protein AB0870_08095 [Microbacterium proteolyticum]|uniref:hypothetical protein n=1 Tax=Microbacterium proteolyticum TaxID=1572644 RepID=UPI002415C878|nr:hypothetical protein [Microbacterium proteolyticum]
MSPAPTDAVTIARIRGLRFRRADHSATTLRELGNLEASGRDYPRLQGDHLERFPERVLRPAEVTLQPPLRIEVPAAHDAPRAY